MNLIGSCWPIRERERDFPLPLSTPARDLPSSQWSHGFLPVMLAEPQPVLSSFSVPSISHSLSSCQAFFLSSMFLSHWRPWKLWCDLGHRGNVARKVLRHEDQSTPKELGPLLLFMKCHRSRRRRGVQMVAACRCRAAVSGHHGWHPKPPTSSFLPHDRNGTFGSWWKWLDCQTCFSRQTVKTLTVDSSQTRPYSQVTTLNYWSWQKIISNSI